MTKLQHVDVFFLAKLSALSFGVLGLFAGSAYSFGGFFFELFTGGLNAGTAMAFLALIAMPVLFAALGFVAGALIALIYNVSARFGFTIENGWQV